MVCFSRRSLDSLILSPFSGGLASGADIHTFSSAFGMLSDSSYAGSQRVIFLSHCFPGVEAAGSSGVDVNGADLAARIVGFVDSLPVASSLV